MISTSCFLTALEHTKFVFGRGFAPDHTGGAYSDPSQPLAGLSGATSKGEGEGKREGKGKHGREGRDPLFANSWIRLCRWHLNLNPNP